jgi:diguanylate cyclase (GGDEF)-like protein
MMICRWKKIYNSDSVQGEAMIQGSNTKSRQDGGAGNRQPGGRLGLLVNSVCDVMELRRNLKEMSFLADFFRSVNSTLILEDVLEAAARKIYQYFRYNLMVVSLTAVGEERIMAFSPRDIEHSPEELAAILKNHSGLRAHDVKGYRCLGLNGPEGSLAFGNTNFLELPLNLGSVTVYSEFNFINHFSDAMLEGMMESFATALHNSLEYEKVKDLSMRDGLTGLFNRRVLEEMLELESHKRQVDPLSLLIIDLDYFKQVNDTHGHPAGDLVLQTVARVLRESTRGSDLVVRSGGEEFSAMLPSVSLAGALEVGERIRSNIERTMVTYNGRSIAITASVGVAHRSERDLCTVKELETRADNALYEAKRGGRNRVRAYPAATPAGGTTTDDRKAKGNPRIVRIK